MMLSEQNIDEFETNGDVFLEPVADKNPSVGNERTALELIYRRLLGPESS